VGFVVDKADLGQIFSEYLVSFTKHSADCVTPIIIQYHPGLITKGQ
jgi:hypothetical protein